jgi:hypothetical protein
VAPTLLMQFNLMQSLILSWKFENIYVHRWTHVLEASTCILNVFLSKYHLRDSYVIAENQLCKFRTSRKNNPVKHLNISQCQPLLIWRPYWKTYAKFKWRFQDLKKGGSQWIQTLSAILGASFWDLQYLFHFEKSCCKRVCVCL